MCRWTIASLRIESPVTSFKCHVYKEFIGNKESRKQKENEENRKEKGKQEKDITDKNQPSQSMSGYELPIKYTNMINTKQYKYDKYKTI